MGNNAAFATFQHTVITLYNFGVLNRHVLDTLAEYHRDTDINPGGYDEELVGYDGLELDKICINTIFPGWQPEKQEDKKYRKPEEWEEEEWEDVWFAIMDERWGWK